MATDNWPATGRKVPKDIGKHAARLKVEFDSVSDTVNASLSGASLLPAGLASRIEIGLDNGIAEARSNGYCPKWSVIDKTIFSKVLLKNITNTTALEARDRVPLPQFHGLHGSFNELYTKLEPQFSTTSQTRPAVAAPVATQPAPAVNPVSAAPKHNTDRGPIRAPKSAAPARQKETAKSVSSEDTDSDTGTNTSEGEEEESVKEVDARDGQGLTESEEVNSGEESIEDGSDGTYAASDSEEGVCNIVRDGNGFKTNIILNIEQQATVNRLEGMTAAELSACLSSSLKKYLRKQQLSSRSVQIADQILLDDGHVKIDLQAETQEPLQQLIGSGNWDQDFERLVCPGDLTTCVVRMHSVEINTVRLKNRKEKAATIKMLASQNRPIRADDQASRDRPFIRDIHWPDHDLQKRKSSLMVGFLDPEDANHALNHGLFWQRHRHMCEREEKNHRLLRCNKCQAYGHLDAKCSDPRRCGKCAGSHHTATCKSTTVKCASCGHGHKVGNNKCPAKIEARREIYFPPKSSPPSIKPAAEAQATPSPHIRHSTSAARTQTETSMPSPVSLDAADENIESEREHLLREANPSPDTHPDYASVKRELDDLRREVAALQHRSPSRTKRQADEAFAGGAEAESSYKYAIPVKRLKKEQPSREGSMGLYRQPSPYIVNRSC